MGEHMMPRTAQVPTYTPDDPALRKPASSSVRPTRSALRDGPRDLQWRRRANGHADDDWFGAASEYAARETTEPRQSADTVPAVRLPTGFRHARA